METAIEYVPDPVIGISYRHHPDHFYLPESEMFNGLLQEYLNASGQLNVNDSPDFNTSSSDETDSRLTQLKEQVKNFILAQHLQWVSWSILMLKPILQKAFVEDKLIDDDEKLNEIFKEA